MQHSGLIDARSDCETKFPAHPEHDGIHFQHLSREYAQPVTFCAVDEDCHVAPTEPTALEVRPDKYREFGLRMVRVSEEAKSPEPRNEP